MIDFILDLIVERLKYVFNRRKTITMVYAREYRFKF